jgi:NTP pyrophosphatase (non-canonical NTP hydrolase)
MNMNNLTQKIKDWAVERELDEAEPEKQMLKLMEEVGELSEGIAKGKLDKVADGIGDSFVVLTILAEQMNLDIEECVSMAFNEIKDRKGKMINGVFVKNEDLE